jgi:hypothetical protein
VAAEAGLGSTFTGGTTNPVYTISLANILEQNAGSETNLTTGNETLRTYTLPAGVLSGTGEFIDIEAKYNVTPNINNKIAKITIAGNTIGGTLNGGIATVTVLYMKIRLIRITATSLAYVFAFERQGAIGNVVDSVSSVAYTTVVCNNLDSATNVINFDADGTTAADMDLFYNSIILYKK